MFRLPGKIGQRPQRTRTRLSPSLRAIQGAAFAFVVIAVAPPTALASGKQREAKPKPKQAQTAPDSPANDNQVNIDIFKQKYWAQGEQTDLNVVQNRLYSKALKLELGFFGGLLSYDPFLNVKSAGGSIGFHFNEYFGLTVLGWKDYTSHSSAYDAFVAAASVGTNNNAAKEFWGAEIQYSPIYGKLSVAGLAIIYYDLHLLGGAGKSMTDNGLYLTPMIGIGQQVYLNKLVSLRIDYRLLEYKESIIQRIDPATYGQTLRTQSTFTNTLTLGLNFLLF